MPGLSTLQEARLMEIARQVKVAVDELRDAAATSCMHDAKYMTRNLFLQIDVEKTLPSEVRQELVRPLEVAWELAVSGGSLFRRTHGAISHLNKAEEYILSLLAHGTMH